MPRLKVTFYTKNECTLCNLVLDMLRDLREELSFEFYIVDITRSLDAWRLYWDKVPVIEAGEEILSGRIDESELRGFLLRKT